MPHYVAQPPSPKATLALLRGVEDVLDVPLPLADLPEEARAWERGVDELRAHRAANDLWIPEIDRSGKSDGGSRSECRRRAKHRPRVSRILNPVDHDNAAPSADIECIKRTRGNFPDCHDALR